MQIKKIKMKDEDGKKRISIEYEKLNRNGMSDEFLIKSYDLPRPEFENAMKKLDQHVVDICELDCDTDDIIVTGVSFSWSTDDTGSTVMGASIIAQKKLVKSNVNLNLVSPHKIERFYSENGGDELSLLPDECIDDLCDLLNEAEKYINGKRAQMSLFDNPNMTITVHTGSEEA